jgi:hypothetical protein
MLKVIRELFASFLREQAALIRQTVVFGETCAPLPALPAHLRQTVTSGMMWALFADGKQISRAFETEKEAWHLARKSALIDQGRLPPGFEIRRMHVRNEAA